MPLPLLTRIRACLLAWLLMPGLAFAQGALTGVAQDSVTHQPLAFASVFLANTTLGVTTTERGEFTFPRVPAGTYDLVGSYVGYRLARLPVVMGAAPRQVTLRLAPAASQLGEVVVRGRPHARRPGDYQTFAELFLGRSTFSRQCRIANPKDVVVDYDPEANELTASADNFVQVDNQALGYRIRYYGLRFKVDFKQSILTFYGQPVFEEMKPRTEKQQRQWLANRAQAYHGSLTHFLKSVSDNRVAAEGFLAQRLRVVPNPRFARADSLARATRRRLPGAGRGGLTPAEQDSVRRWQQEPRTLATLYAGARPPDSLRRLSADGRHVFLRFRDRLQVSYLLAGPDPLYRPATQPTQPGPEAPAGPEQVSQLLLLQPEIEIQPNGQLANPLAVFTDEYWGFEKMGEFLPVNYLPPAPTPHP